MQRTVTKNGKKALKKILIIDVNPRKTNKNTQKEEKPISLVGSNQLKGKSHSNDWRLTRFSAYTFNQSFLPLVFSSYTQYPLQKKKWKRSKYSHRRKKKVFPILFTVHFFHSHFSFPVLIFKKQKLIPFFPFSDACFQLINYSSKRKKKKNSLRNGIEKIAQLNQKHVWKPLSRMKTWKSQNY